MAKVYFYYSTMNAGKSSALLQNAFNYREMSQKAILFTAAIDNRYGEGEITSRIGLREKAFTFPNEGSIFANYEEATKLDSTSIASYDVIMVDEAQFLKKEQVKELALFAWRHNVPVVCYGLRLDFRGELFEGSAALFAYATKFYEMKTICECGKRATHVVRLNENGNVVTNGDVVEIGGNDRYRSLCQPCFFSKTEVKIQGMSGYSGHRVITLVTDNPDGKISKVIELLESIYNARRVFLMNPRGSLFESLRTLLDSYDTQMTGRSLVGCPDDDDTKIRQAYLYNDGTRDYELRIEMKLTGSENADADDFIAYVIA